MLSTEKKRQREVREHETIGLYGIEYGSDWETVERDSTSTRRTVRLVRFILNDNEKAHIDHLRKLVDRRLVANWGCQRVYENEAEDCTKLSYKSSCPVLNTDYILDFQFYNLDFCLLDLHQILSPEVPWWERRYTKNPVFSFVDPFGFSLPFDKMRQLLSDSNRAVLIVFMVQSINRSKSTKSRRLVDAIFGEEGDGDELAGWEIALRKAGPEPTRKSSRQHTEWTNRRLEALAKHYCKRLRQSLGKKTTMMVMRKGKSSPKTGTIFYECFAGNTTLELQRTKTAMQGLVQGEPEDGFSDCYALNNIEVKSGRKTTDEEEAEEIYKKFQGRAVMLYKIREFVLDKTNFPYHKRPLAVLERSKKIAKVNTYGQKRKKFTFGGDRWYSQFWNVQFASDEEWRKRNEEEEGLKRVPPEKKDKKRADEKNPGNKAQNKKAKVSNKTQKRTAEKKKTQIKKAKTSNRTSAPKNKKKAEEAWIQSGRDFMHKWMKKNSKAIIESKSE